jgi:hypothetical protein
MRDCLPEQVLNIGDGAEVLAPLQPSADRFVYSRDTDTRSIEPLGSGQSLVPSRRLLSCRECYCEPRLALVQLTAKMGAARPCVPLHH